MIFFLFFAAANFKLSGRLIRPQKKWPPPAAISFRFIYALLYPDGNPDLVGGGPGYLVPPGFQPIKHLIRKGLILRPIQTKAGYHAPLGQIQILLGDIAVKELLHPLQGLFSPLYYAI